MKLVITCTGRRGRRPLPKNAARDLYEKHPPTAKAVGGCHRVAISSTKVDFIYWRGRSICKPCPCHPERRNFAACCEMTQSNPKGARSAGSRAAVFYRFVGEHSICSHARADMETAPTEMIPRRSSSRAAACLFKIRNLLQILKSSTAKTSTRDVFFAQDDTRGRPRRSVPINKKALQSKAFFIAYPANTTPPPCRSVRAG